MQGVVICPGCAHLCAAGTRYCGMCGELLGSKPGGVTTAALTQHLLHKRYHIERRLARGGQSTVYLATDTLQHDRLCAIKEMTASHLTGVDHDEAIRDFLREATILELLTHPHLLQVSDNFVENGQYFMVMEYVEGQNLSDLLEMNGAPLPIEKVQVWALQLCDVLDYLHRQKVPIIYRDLKPDNIMVRQDGSIVLIDFGIARFQRNDPRKDTTCFGTDGYAPLEQYSGKTSPVSDIYALGATLYHLLTNQVPASALDRAVHGTALISPSRLNPTLSPAVQTVIEKALALQSEDRYPNVESFKAAILAAFPSTPDTTPTSMTAKIGASETTTLGAEHAAPTISTLGKPAPLAQTALLSTQARIILVMVGLTVAIILGYLLFFFIRIGGL